MPSPPSKSTSVFQALGSYADRIREQGGSPNGKAEATLGAATPQAATPSLSTSSTPPSSTPVVSKVPSPATREIPAPVAVAAAAPDEADDGSWEVVSGRSRSRPEKQEEKRGSNSRNWRERDEKSEPVKKESDEVSTERRGKKDKSFSKSHAGSSGRQSTSSGGKSSAWGSSQQSNAAGEGANKSSATPSTPTTEDSKPPAAPASSSESKAPTQEQQSKPKAGSADAEGSWRARPKAAAEPSPAPPAPRQAAPPPAVNAWDVRKKTLKTVAQEPTPAATASETPAPEANPEVKAGGGKKKKKHSGEHHHHHHHHADSTLWPDVSQAAETTKSTDDKRAKNDKKETESSVSEEPSAPIGGKKQKWMAIPAAELQEAADRAAVATRRQTGKTKGRGKEWDSGDGKRGKKGGEAKKAPRMQRSGSQGSEARLPPFVEAARGALPNGTRADLVNGDGYNAFVNGTLSAPLSRQGSQQSKRASPLHSSVPLSPSGGGEFDTARMSNGANGPRSARGRERDGRGGYGGGRGGRGGYRSASTASMRTTYPELSPVAGTTELANIYQRGYGMGYNYYPIATGGFVVAPPGYDAAQYAATMQAFPRSMPPPPLPVTQVSNIDALRYYVLGQVEYYFSMQNLVMDFFLRQQMDSQGWIEISMIASFNRIKSLTPDVSVVREVMEMSSLLEVKEDMVRLAGDEALRWVLPDAPPCKFSGGSPGRNLSPKKLAGEGAELSHGLPGTVDPTTGSALGIEDVLGPPVLLKFDVENALMRNVRDGSANMSTSSTASVLASEEGKTMTPETSIAGDSKSDFDAEDIKIEQQ